MSNTPGIDYSPPGATCNRDAKTGIRYGIIHQHQMSEWLWDSVESIYHARCPSCAMALPKGWDDDDDNPACPSCCNVIEDGEQYGDEPDEQVIDTDGIKGMVDSSGDVWCISSPYYTRGTFCSPCAPGAVSLDSPCAEGAKAYCFPHDWYTGDKAPYPVHQVSDDAEVEPG